MLRFHQGHRSPFSIELCPVSSCLLLFSFIVNCFDLSGVLKNLCDTFYWLFVLYLDHFLLIKGTVFDCLLSLLLFVIMSEVCENFKLKCKRLFFYVVIAVSSKKVWISQFGTSAFCWWFHQGHLPLCSIKLLVFPWPLLFSFIVKYSDLSIIFRVVVISLCLLKIKHLCLSILMKFLASDFIESSTYSFLHFFILLDHPVHISSVS